MSRYTAAQLYGMTGARVVFEMTNLKNGEKERHEGILTDVAHHSAVGIDAVRIYTTGGFKVTLAECVVEVVEQEVEE